jgi:predicted amidophosphoribosyltransferase
MKLTKIDSTIISDHYYLSSADTCYFLWNYKAGVGFSAGGINQQILNFKIAVNLKGENRYQYKIDAIEGFANDLKKTISSGRLKNCVFVPIPPSKCKKDPLHDDRMLITLQKSFGATGDIRELILTKKSIPAVHNSPARPTIQNLLNNLKIDNALDTNIPDVIILVDDLITTGAHFKACKELLQSKFTDAKIVGLFIARREI